MPAAVIIRNDELIAAVFFAIPFCTRHLLILGVTMQFAASGFGAATATELKTTSGETASFAVQETFIPIPAASACGLSLC